MTHTSRSWKAAILLAALAYVPIMGLAAVPLEKVPDFAIRVRLTAEQPPEAFKVSAAGTTLHVAPGAWSEWIPFGRDVIEAALRQYPNSYSNQWPVKLSVSISPIPGTVRVELEAQVENRTDTGTAELTGSSLGLAVWREEDGTGHATTLGTYNRLKYWSLVDKLNLRGRLPTKIVLQDRFIPGDSDYAALIDGVAGLRKIGFNCLLTDGNEELGSLGRSVGIHMFKGAIYNPPGYAFDFSGDQSTEVALRDWARSIVARFQAGNYRADEVAFYTTSDEPGWYYPAMYRTVNDNPVYLERFHNYLRQQNFKPEDFGYQAWSEVKMIGRSQARGPLPQRKLFYWSQRFIPYESAQHFARATRAIEEAFYTGIPVVVNWNFFAARSYFPGPFAHNQDKTSPDAAMGSHDWFEFGRLRGSNSLYTEDWFGDEWAYQWSFYSDKLRSASSTGEFGALVIPRVAGAMEDGIIYKIMSLVGHGSKCISFFVFGPEYNFPGNCYSQNQRVFAGLARAMRLVGEAEELLYPGRPVKPQVALLHHRSAEFWDQLGMEIARGIVDATNTNLNGACSEYTAELYDLYLALMHEQVPVEFISEDDATWGALDQFKVIYVIEPNVPQRTQRRLADWVKAGGVLVTTSQAAAYDEYNDPCSILDEVRGLSEEPRERLVFANLDAMNPVGTVNGPFGEFTAYGARGTFATLSGHDKTTIEGQTPRWEARSENAVQVLGHFYEPDSQTPQPILTVNRYGHGKAIHVAFLPGISYRRSAKDQSGRFAQGFSAAARACITLPLNVAGVTKPVILDRPMVEAPLLASDKGLAITLLNWTNEPVRQLNVQVSVDRPVASVKLARTGKSVRWRERGHTLTAQLDMDTVDVLMIQYR